MSRTLPSASPLPGKTLPVGLLGVVLVALGAAVAGAAPQGETPAPVPPPALFDDFDDRKEYPTAEALRGLLAQVPGEPFEIAEAKKWERPIRRISGLLRLNASWSAGLALRISILDPQQLQLHLWSGTRGVTLRYYPEYHQTWAAYATTREAGKPRPAELALWGTSEDYYRRSGVGTVELHVQAGKLLLVRGDLTLLAVPMEGPPQEVYLEGSGLVRGLALVPSNYTPEPVRTRPAVLESARPAELPWETKPSEGMALQRHSDGRVQLAADEKTQQAQADISLQEPGLYEIVFEVEGADLGTGVSLADAEGKPICRVAFLRHRESGRKVFDLLAPWANDKERSYDPNKQPVPYAGPRQWLRVICGGGLFKLFTSGDGVHWRQPILHSPSWEGTCVRVGLFCLQADQKRSITLCSLAVRKLDTLYAVVPEPVYRRVDTFDKRVNKPEQWQEWVVDSRPADVSPRVWWRACVLRTLVLGLRPNLAQPLLNRLQQDVLEESPGQAVDWLVQFMEDCALVHATEDWAALERLLPEVRRFGRTLVRRGHPTPLTAASQAVMRWPWWSPRRLPVFSDDLLRHELFLRVGQDRDDETREFCRRMRFWSRSGGPREGDAPMSAHGEYLVQWADPSLTPGSGRVRRGRRPARAPTFQAAHPLVEQIGKEGYNVISDLRAAIDGQAYREAAQILGAVPSPEKLGLVPDSDDARLLLSYPLAAAAEVRSCPQLQTTIQAEFDKIGQLRLKRAAAAGDEAGVEAIGPQFPGTPAAVEADRWLGDRRLSAGRFAEALALYRRAAVGLPASERDALAARYRLTGAVAGYDLGRPVEAPVRLGSVALAPAEFEQMVGALRQARQATASGTAQGGFKPGRYEFRPWAAIEGRNVRRPQGFPERVIDWAGRQTALLSLPGQLVVNNRLELIAFDLGFGRERWSQRIEVEERHQQWPLVPMRPLALADRIFARRLSSDGPELICVNAADGRLAWTSKPDDYVASDPIVIDEKLLVLTGAHDGTGKIGLFLVELHTGSGRARSRTPLAEFRDSARRPLSCQVTVAEARLVVSAAGCVLACGPTGRVHWVRRQVWAPAPASEFQSAREWFEQLHEPPLAAPGRVYATQPGVWGIECLDLESGRLLWRQGSGNLARLVGRVADRLVIETADGPAALDPETGKLLWAQEVKECLLTRLAGEPAAILSLALHVARRPDRQEPSGMRLSWFDPAEGRALGSCIMEAKVKPGWHVGPLGAGAGRQWLAFATQQEPARRELLEAVRVGDPEAPQ